MKPNNILYPISQPQWKKLRKLLTHISQTNPFYKTKYEKNGYKLSNIKGPNDFFKLPTTTKEELLKDQKKFPPYGRNASEKLSRYPTVWSTSGTTSKTQLLIPTSARDNSASHKINVKGYKTLKISASDRVIDLHTPAIHLKIAPALESIGAIDIPWSLQTPSKLIRLLAGTKATVLIASTGMHQYIIDVADKEQFDLSKTNLKFVISSSEKITPQIQNRIENAYGVECKKYVGSSEFSIIGYGCFEAKNQIIYHHFTDESIFEIIDTKTNKHSEEGELVLTNLMRFDFPFIRYHTGNYVKLIRGHSCSCKHKKYHFDLIGRSDRHTRFRGRDIYPNELVNEMLNLNYLKDFQISLRRSILGAEYMLVKIVPTDFSDFNVRSKVGETIFASSGVKPTVEIVRQLRFELVPLKKRYFLDLREERQEKDINSKLLNSRTYRFLHYNFFKPLINILYKD